MTEIKEEDKERKFKLLVLGIGHQEFIHTTQELLGFKQQILQDHEDAKKWEENMILLSQNINDDLKQALKDRQIVKRLGETLELLVYPYLIETNTVKNILCTISGKKIQDLDLSKYNTSDILFIAKQLKKGILNEEEIQKILEGKK